MADRTQARHGVVRAAKAERAAALVLADPRCDPGDAAVLIQRGWQHLEASGAVSADTAPEIREDAGKRELRKERRALARAVRRARGSVESWPTRALRMALPLAVGVTVAWGGWTLSDVWGERSEWGWRGAIYPELDHEGEPLMRRDLSLRFQWFEAAPYPGGPEDEWSGRWDTCLRVPEDQRIEVRLGSDDGSRLLVDGEKVVDLWSDHGFTWNNHQLDLEAGVHHLRVDYYDKGGKAALELKLIRPGIPDDLVPLEWTRVPTAALGTRAPCGGT